MRPDLREEYKRRAQSGYAADKRMKAAYMDRCRAQDVPAKGAPSDVLPTGDVQQSFDDQPSASLGIFHYSLDETVDIGELLGQGGHAVVYSCHCLGVRLAIKIHRNTRPASSSARDAERFSSARQIWDLARESYVLGRVSGHPNVLRMYGMITSSTGTPGILMDICKGNLQALLRAWVHDEHMPPWTQVRTKIVKLYEQVLAGLLHVHQKHVVHLDVKTNNFLVSDENDVRVQLADFGLARMLPSKDAEVCVYGDEVCNQFYRPIECLFA